MSERPREETGSASTVAEQNPGEEGLLHRHEAGSAGDSQRHPPHVTENDGPAVPHLPANASGSDKVTTAEQDRGIDPASMYDRRPEEDKDQPPSERAEE